MMEEMFAGYCALVERLIEDDAAWPSRGWSSMAPCRSRCDSGAIHRSMTRRADCSTPVSSNAFTNNQMHSPLLAPPKLTYNNSTNARCTSPHQIRVNEGQLVAVQMQKGWEQSSPCSAYCKPAARICR